MSSGNITPAMFKSAMITIVPRDDAGRDQAMARGRSTDAARATTSAWTSRTTSISAPRTRSSRCGAGGTPRTPRTGTATGTIPLFGSISTCPRESVVSGISGLGEYATINRAVGVDQQVEEHGGQHGQHRDGHPASGVPTGGPGSAPGGHR